MAIPPQNVDDAYLAYRRTRDPAALAAVYDATALRLFAVALHLSNRATLAEDAVQDTFLTAMEHPEQWDETRPVMPWLMGILANRVRESLQRSRRLPDPDQILARCVSDPESLLQANEAILLIEDGITRLPQPYRAVVLLKLRNGLSTADIAVALGRKASTIRTQLARGVELLRKALPAGVAGMLAATAVASPGLAATREVVLHRAAQLHAAWRSHYRVLQLRSLGGRVLLATAAAAVFAGMALLFPAPVAPVEVVPNSPTDVAALEPTFREEALSQGLGGGVPGLEREVVAAPGGLSVSVRRPGRVMASARIELEHLGDRPRAIKRFIADPRGDWFEIALPDGQAGKLEQGWTDGNGCCRFDDLQPGSWICRTLGRSEIVDVHPAAVTNVDMVVAAECRVLHGLVLDSRGAPAADAGVWTCQYFMQRFGVPAVRTDDAGRFELAVAPFTTVGVVHAGHAPVAMTTTSVGGGPLEVLFELREEGARLAGIVVDEQDRPVAGADVQVGHPFDARFTPKGTEPIVAACPQRVRTDAEGRFVLASLVPGETWVAACGAGHGEHGRTVVLEAGRQAEVRLTLPGVATIEGHVCDADGNPVVGASVRVGPLDALGHRSTLTDARGAYRLTDVTPGRQVVTLTDYAGGFARREHVCEAGEQWTWNPTLAVGGLQLAGRVLAAGDRPLAGGWIVQFAPAGPRIHPLDHDGRFQIAVSEHEAALTTTLQVYDEMPHDQRGSVMGVPRAIVRGVKADGEEVLIRLPARGEDHARLTGRIVAPRSDPGRAFLVRVGDLRASWGVPLDLGANGEFRSVPVPPGSYYLCHVAAGALHRRILGLFELAPRQEREAGVLEAEPPAGAAPDRRARVQFAWVFPRGSAGAEEVLFQLLDEGGRVVADGWNAGTVHPGGDASAWLPEGSFRLIASTPSGLVGKQVVVVDRRKRSPRVVLVTFE